MSKDDSAPKPAPTPPTPEVVKPPKGRQKGLRSRLNHPTTIVYGDDVIVLPPKGWQEKLDQTMIGTLPAGVIMYDPANANNEEND